MERIDIFSQTENNDLSRFKPKAEQAPVPTIPAEGKFVSREVRKPVRVVSDRHYQFNSRVNDQTRTGFEEISMRLNLPRGEVLARALAALQRELDGV